MGSAGVGPRRATRKRWQDRLVLPLCATLLVLLAQSPSPKDLYARAVQLEADGNHPAALALLWEAAGLAPRDADVQQRLGESLERMGALEAAIAAYRRAAAARPDFIRADNSLTLALAKAGRGPEAVERARGRLAEAPTDAERSFTLGLALSEQDVEEAIRTFRRVIAMRPDHALAHYNLALVLKRVDRAKEAISSLQRALDLQPRAEAYFALGTLYLHQGDFDRAVDALRAAVAAEPRLVDAHITLASAFRARRQLPEAIDALRRAIALQPESWSAHAALATVLQQAGAQDAAAQEMAEAERRRLDAAREREAASWTSVGIARLDADDAAAAVEPFRRAISAMETYAPAHYQLGRALQRLGQDASARAAFTRAYTLNPSLVPPERSR
jgi:tetratricopeptide (TPR) repeat protein